MNTGMQDAFNLAWKLALTSKGRATETLLDSYSPERSYVGDKVLKNAERLTVIGTTRSPVVRTVRDVVGHLALGLAHVQHNLADTMTEVSVGYPESPLNAGSASRLTGPAPGQRVMSDRSFGADGEPRFALMAVGEAATSLIERHADVLETALRSPPDPGCVWLVRPDGYVVVAAKNRDISAVESSLVRFTK
jgi:hypothetical protein